MTYTCQICHNMNHVAKLHCSTCGAVPACYSVYNYPLKLDTNIQILVPFGCERQASRKTIKRTARTVPLDYYAEV